MTASILTDARGVAQPAASRVEGWGPNRRYDRESAAIARGGRHSSRGTAACGLSLLAGALADCLLLRGLFCGLLRGLLHRLLRLLLGGRLGLARRLLGCGLVSAAGRGGPLWRRGQRAS